MNALRRWSADEQVALLFVVLFGLLLLASAVVALLVLRERSGAQQDRQIIQDGQDGQEPYQRRRPGPSEMGRPYGGVPMHIGGRSAPVLRKLAE